MELKEAIKLVKECESYLYPTPAQENEALDFLISTAQAVEQHKAGQITQEEYRIIYDEYPKLKKAVERGVKGAKGAKMPEKTKLFKTTTLSDDSIHQANHEAEIHNQALDEVRPLVAKKDMEIKELKHELDVCVSNARSDASMLSKCSFELEAKDKRIRELEETLKNNYLSKDKQQKLKDLGG